MPQAPKMTDLIIEETSGVDHPAHLHEGWLVIKTSNIATEAQVVETLTKHDDQSLTQVKEAGMSDEQASKGGGYMDDEEMMQPKAVEDDLAMAMARIAELESRIQELESAETEAEMPEMPEGEAPTPEMKEALQLAKAAPEPVRKMLEAMVKEKAEAQAALRKEREERADQEAVAKAREDYKHLTMDHEAVGPALRRLALVDAELAKSVETALKAADAQNESADIFTEIGKSGAEVNNSAYQKMVGLAKAAVADGRVESVQQGIALVATTDPSLYNEYLIEKGA